MRLHSGKIREVILQAGGEIAAWISCPVAAVPAPGRYMMAWAPDDLEAPLATPLFAGEILTDGFVTACELPKHWYPGQELRLRGPLGGGFHPPQTLHRLALAGLGRTANRLLPLAADALQRGAAVALFSDSPLPPLPPAIETHPLEALRESLDWPDYLAVDLPASLLIRLAEVLGLNHDHLRLNCEAEALVMTQMPCGGLGECGVCSLEVAGRPRLACKDGPVFRLNDLI
jgi:NAD(P)H-flavin reductase